MSHRPISQSPLPFSTLLNLGTVALIAVHRASARNLVARIRRVTLLLALACLVCTAQNPGDPLFCQPQEGTTFLIVNGGAGVFTVDPDCYNNNANNDTTLTIATGQGGA